VQPTIENREVAEQAFTAALEIAPRDLDALELRGRQRIRGNDQGALADFEDLERAAQGTAVRAARACRCQAMVLEQRGTKAALTEARRRLERGLNTINAQGSLNEEAWFERGLLHRAYGNVQIKRRGLPSARQHLADAISCFKKVGREDARIHETGAKSELAGITPHASPDERQASSLERMLAWIKSVLTKGPKANR
jgi:tetratricopeptide (TPR) repeat protein